MPIHRTIKNVVHNYTYAEVKVREATSNDPWGPSSSLMAEIAELTTNPLSYNEVMAMIWRRMNDHGKNWRHVYKSLVLLEFLMKHGSDRVTRECKANIVAVRTLADFQHVDENGRDNGLAVREKARQLALLLGDDERLRSERIRAHDAQEHFDSSSSSRRDRESPPTVNVTRLDKYPSSHSGSSRQGSRPPASNSDAPATSNEEEIQLQLALALSKEEHEEEMKRQKADELKLQMAIEESKKTALASQAVRSQKSKTRSSFDAGPSSSASTKSNLPSASLLDSLSRDPWAIQSSQPPTVKSSTPRRDPWADIADVPSMSHASSSKDPWADLRSSSPVPVIVSDIAREVPETLAPWEEVEARISARNGTFPSEKSSTKSKTPAAFSLLDDDSEFAALSLRPKGEMAAGGPVTKNGTASVDLLDMTYETSTSDLLGVLKPEQAKKLTPEEFLGPNAKLVDFDDLVSKPTPQSTVNPFAMTVGKPAVANPFVARAKEEELSRRIPINQMSSGSGLPGSTSGSTVATSTLYPTLAVVYSPQTVPVPPQQQGYNPFL